MSTQYNTTEALLTKITTPADQQLDLGINVIDDTSLRTPYGSVRMNLLGTRMPYGSVRMNALGTRMPYGSLRMNVLGTRMPYGSLRMNLLATKSVSERA